MGTISYFLGVAVALIILFVVAEMLRRGKLRERHAFWWLVFGLLNLLVAVFPVLLINLSRFLGVELPINLVFFVGIMALFLVNIQQASELTKFEEKTRILAENQALLEKRIRDLENGKEE